MYNKNVHDSEKESNDFHKIEQIYPVKGHSFSLYNSVFEVIKRELQKYIYKIQQYK